MTIQTYPTNFANLDVPQPPRDSVLVDWEDVKAEMQELVKFREDGAKGKGYSGSSGMVHRIDVLKRELSAANRKITQMEMHRNLAVECERAVCSRVLLALAGAHVCTPLEGYGTNVDWAINDLIRVLNAPARAASEEK